MEPFVEMFFAIDKNRSEEISREELVSYVEDNHIDKNMITRWNKLFDPENTGRITLEKFCDVLGLKMEEARSMRTTTQNASPHLNPDIILIRSDMDTNSQHKVGERAIYYATLTKDFDPEDASQQLKKWLDENLDPKWHVVIAKGPFWITYSFCPKTAFHFSLYDYTYLVWRTPGTEYVFS